MSNTSPGKCRTPLSSDHGSWCSILGAFGEDMISRPRDTNSITTAATTAQNTKQKPTTKLLVDVVADAPTAPAIVEAANTPIARISPPKFVTQTLLILNDHLSQAEIT